MSALPEDLQLFLDAERDIDAPAPAERARLIERLEPLLLPAAVVLTGAVATAGTTSAAAGSAAGAADGAGSSALSAALKLKIGAAIVSAALAGGAAGVAGHAYVVTRAFRAEVAAPPSVTPRSAPGSVAAAESVVAPPVESVAEPVPPASAPSAPHQGQQPPAGSLRAERLLIETASAALMRGDPKAALVALRRHAQKFPHGDLAEEREALLKKALLAAAADAGTPKSKD
jgi:hypothetical protein